jgi:DME family drug/metabolite transporter
MMGELAALGAALSWTVSAMLYRKALSETKPLSANVVRLTCTSAALVVFLALIGKLGVLMRLSADVAVLAGISGVIGLGVGDTLYMMSLKSIGVARAVPITCTYPLFSLIWAARFKGELVTLPVGLGAIAIVLGIWLLSQENKTNNAGIQKKDLYKGVAFALATAMAWSISITMINMAVKETADLDHALAINTVRVTAIAIVLFASSPLISRGLGFGKMDRKAVVTLLVGGIVALGLGWFFLTYSFIETLESRAVPISSTTPLFSTLAGMAFLREKVTARNFLGSVVIVAGIFLIFLV